MLIGWTRGQTGGLLAGWLGSMLHLSDSRMCQAPSSLLPPPPGFPLCPLHSLARALTCEIKRHFNYLSAKQQLERITAQQHTPPTPRTGPACCPSLQSPSGAEARCHGKSSNSSQHLCSLHPRKELVLGIEAKEFKRLHRKKKTLKPSSGFLCLHLRDSTQLLKVQVGTTVCVYITDALVPVGACAVWSACEHTVC